MSGAELATGNVARLNDIYSRYAAGDRVPLFDALAEDVVWRSVGGEGRLPWSGTWTGLDGVATYFDRLDDNARITGYALEHVIAQGEWVAVLAEVTVRFETGEEVRFDKADFIRMRDGKLIEFREFYDTARACDACRGF